MATAKTAPDDKAASAAADDPKPKSQAEPEVEQAPAPPAPEPTVDRSAQGTIVGSVNVRDNEFDVPDYYVDPSARKDDEGNVPEDDAPDGTQVDVFQVSVSGNGVLLLVNDQALLLSGTQAIQLKKDLDAAVMSGVH